MMVGTSNEKGEVHWYKAYAIKNEGMICPRPYFDEPMLGYPAYPFVCG